MRQMGAAIVAMMLASSLQAAVITNSTFDDGMTGWTQFGSVTASSSGGVLSLASASGTGNGVRSDVFAIEPEMADSGYDLSVDIQRNGLGTWATVSVVMEWYDSVGSFVGYDIPFSGLNGTVAWETFTKHYDSLPAGTAQGVVVLRLEYGGWYAEFDNVTFGATVPEPMTLAMVAMGGLAFARKRM